MRAEPVRVARFAFLFLFGGAVGVFGGMGDASAQSETQSSDPVQDAATGEAGEPETPEQTSNDSSLEPAGQEAEVSAPEATAPPPDQDDARDEAGDEPGAAAADAEVAAAEPEPETSIKVGGAMRVTYAYKTWDDTDKDRLGSFFFDTFRVNADGKHGPLRLSAEYRFYSGYHMLHHGYVGYAVDDKTQIDVGVSQVPFGLLKYASHNWFFDITYYLGFEDDYDMGVRTSFDLGDLDLWLAFYKNSEGTYTGASAASARYSYDVVPATVADLGYAGLAADRNDSETNQVNVRATYTLSHGDSGTTELGLSGRLGGLYNADTAQTGLHWAAAAHLNGTYGPINVQLQGIGYAFEPELPDGQDDTVVIMGAYDAPYFVAAKGTILSANLAYNLPLNAGPVSSLTFYNDYSVVLKSEESFETTHQNVTGMLVAAGPIYTYVDMAMGRNHPWLGGAYGTALAAGEADADWHGRFNINIGYYF